MKLVQRMAQLHVPAVSMAAIRNGRIDWAQAYGVASLGGAKATTHTLFCAASISKPVTAMGVLKLVQEGKVNLDADVNQYLKRWKLPDNHFTTGRKVTVRELLNHTSGIGTHNGEIYDPSKPIPTFLQLLDGKPPAKTPPVRVEAIPGTRFAYANGGYLILSLLIEDVTGEPFAKFMKRTVLDPIGMKDSTFDAPLPSRLADRAATAYPANGSTAIPPSKFVEPNLAAGGLWTTPTDLAKFLIEVQQEYEGKSHKVLSQGTAQLMTKAGLASYGLGFRIGGKPGNLYITHEGSAFFENEMFIYLHGGGFVVMTSGGEGHTLADELLHSAGTVYDFPDFKPLERTAIAIPSATLSRYVGTYGFVKVTINGKILSAAIPIGSTPQHLYATSPTHFFVLDGPQELSFDVDAQNHVNAVEFTTPMSHIHLKKD